jgi:CheY-like chemotaxis protein
MTTIMVVDDEQVLLNMVTAFVEDEGHRVLAATDGCEALALLNAEAEPPALIISDIMMPRMNGFSLAHALKNDPRFKHVPLVLMSAAYHSLRGDLADRFIPKPFDLDQIEHLIQTYVTDQPRRHERPNQPSIARQHEQSYQLLARN